MATANLRATPLDEPYVYGWKYQVGRYRAEVVRCYSNQWSVFCYRDGEAVVGAGIDRATKAEAVGFAKTWLSHVEGE